MNNQVFHAMLQTLKAYHNHLNITSDNVKIEIWTEQGAQFFSITWQDMDYLTLSRIYSYNEIDNTFGLVWDDSLLEATINGYTGNMHCDTYGVCGGTSCKNYFNCNH